MSRAARALGACAAAGPELLLCGEIISAGDGIERPCDEVLSYAFVLASLAEIVLAVKHQAAHHTFAEFRNEFEQVHEMRRIVNAVRGWPRRQLP